MKQAAMERDEMKYKIALSFLKKVPLELVRMLPEKEVSTREFFESTKKELSSKLDITESSIPDKVVREEALFNAIAELEKIERHNIEPLFINDDNYPYRLSEIPDAPVIIYKLGEASFDSSHFCSVVGTRRPSPYGTSFTERLVTELSEYFSDVVIVSGLAYGIDSVAHKKCLESGATTIAVVAHGLNMIYPAAHRDLASAIIRNGGAIISEYPFGTKPYRQRFLERNRIVAGLSDVTVVTESPIKGGAMSTANLAFSYSRDVMALPGRTSDELSAGCNLLIRKNKAHLIGCAADLIETTGWRPLDIPAHALQRNLFPELEGDAKTIYEILKFNPEPLQLDRLHQLTGISISLLMSTLGEMEFDGIIMKLPGNRFSLA